MPASKAPETDPTEPKHSVTIFRGLHPTPETSLTALSLSPSPRTPFFALPPSLTSRPSRTIVEICSSKTPYTSWLLRLSPGGDSPPPTPPTAPARKQNPPDPHDVVIDSCGDVTFISAVDPLFAALPMLVARREVNGRPSFQPADALLMDAVGVCLSGCVSTVQLGLVCDVKTIGEDSFFKLCDKKVVRWLQRKVSALVGSGLPGLSPKDALDTVCRYLTEDMVEALIEADEGGKGGEAAVDISGVTDGTALAYEAMAIAAKANAENAKAIEEEWARKREGEKLDDGGGDGISAPKKRKTGGTGSKLDKIDKRGVQSMKSFFGKK